jgi:short-subunit dehydrogenase
MEGFFESMRLENRNTGVHVLIVRPGFTATEIRTRMLNEKGTAQGASHIEEKKSLRADKVAKKIFRAQLRRKPYLMIGSEAFFSFYIKKWFPRLADRLLYSFIKREKDSGLS